MSIEIIRKLSAAFLLLQLFLLSSTHAITKKPPGAEYEYKTWECKIDGNKFVLKTHHKITITNIRGEKYKKLWFYENRSSKLKKINVAVFDSNGKELYKRKKKDFTKACGFSGSALYSDVCTFFLTFDAPQTPYNIEYEIVKESKTLFNWKGQQIQELIPVNHFSYTLDAPTDFIFQHRVKGLSIEPIITVSGSRVIYRWLADDIPALEDIDYLPPGANEPATLELVPDKFRYAGYELNGCSWDEIGDWYASMAESKYLDNNSNMPTLPPNNAEEHAQEIYNDVISSIRYVAVQIGVGGWQPYNAELTSDRGYGDCKDMSTLLISRLRNRGITAYPSLVLTRDFGLTDATFPNKSFNHLITVMITGKDTVWMDPTCDNCPYGDLRSDVEDIDVLVMTDKGGEIWHTAASSSDENKTTRATELFVGSDSRVSFKSRMKVIGNFAASIRGYSSQLNNDEKRTLVGYLFPGADKRFSIESYEIENLEKLEQPVVITIEARLLSKPRKINSVIYLDPYVFGGLSVRELEPLTKREHPLDMRYPNSVEDSINIVWDKSLAIDSVVIPTDDSLVASFGKIHRSSVTTGDSVSIFMSKEYNTYHIEVEDFAEFDEFKAIIKSISNSYIKLHFST